MITFAPNIIRDEGFLFFRIFVDKGFKSIKNLL